MFVLVDNQDSFRKLGGNEILLKCLDDIEKPPKNIVKAIAKVVDGYSKSKDKQTTLYDVLNK